jgi:hypothetical protein
LAQEQRVVVRPKGVLVGGAFTGDRRRFALGTEEGEVAPEIYRVTGIHKQFDDERLNLSRERFAARSLKITPLLDHHRSVYIAVPPSFDVQGERTNVVVSGRATRGSKQRDESERGKDREPASIA